MGGSFNPIHLGHLIAAQDAIEIFELNRVLLVPCDQPPHKPASSLAPAAHRAAMLEAALVDSLTMELCDLELRRGGPSYSIDTVRALIRQYPDREFTFLIGSDTLPELHLWKEAAALLRLCRFATLARPGFDPKAVSASDLNLPPDVTQGLLANVAAGHAIDISSTDIRHRIAEGLSIRYLVPAAVEMYIGEHNLYKT